MAGVLIPLHRHAQVLAPRHHRDILRSGQFLDLIGDPVNHSLLDLEPVSVSVGDPRKLREPKDSLLGDVPDGDLRPEWQKVMLADALHTLIPETTTIWSVVIGSKNVAVLPESCSIKLLPS